jgi:predicted dehydrogenase
MKTYYWGILGAGRIADKFCEALNFTEGAAVYAVASRNAENAQAFASKHKATVCYNNYTDLVNDPNVDVVYIATPHAFHYEHTMLCLQHNKAVLCEKPLSLNSIQSTEMTAVATKQQLFLMEGLWTRFMPFTEKILTLIAEDSIGVVKHIQADFGFAVPFNADSRMYNKALGGGSVLDIGIYPIFLATLILGSPIKVQAIVTPTITGVDETATMQLQYANGASAQLLSTVAYNTPITATIIGTKGRIHIQNPWFKATDITLILNDGATETFSMPHQCNGFEYEIAHVMQCLHNGWLQSPKVPHSLTLQISSIMDEVLKNIG